MIQFILAICGLPASGKSVLADAIQKAVDFEASIVRTDEWRDESYYTDWKPEKEGEVRQSALARVEHLVGEGKSVIHDDTNYYDSMRHDLFKIAIRNRCGYAVVYVSTPIDVARRWNRDRKGTKIPESVIESINERFDLPGRHYLWDDAIVEVNMATQELDTVIPEIVECIEKLVPAREPRPRLITSTEFELLDVETRRIISEFLEEHPELRGNREVSEIRRNILRRASESRVPLRGVKKLLLGELENLQDEQL